MKKVLSVMLSMLMGISLLTGCGGKDNKEAKQHQLIEVNAVDATCTKDGNLDYYKCSKCGKYFSDREGKTEITDKDSVIVKAKGHSLVHHDGKSATCTEMGWEAYDTCKNCDYTTYRTILPTGHKFELVETKEEATCEKDGIEVYKCSVCGETEERVVKTKGHKVEKYTYNNDATCTKDGTEWGTCSICGKKITRIAVDTATGHMPDESKKVVVNPTCTERGYTKNVCKVCGESYISHYVEELGHDMTEDIYIEKTCEHGTITGHKCTRCDHQETSEADDKISHDFDEKGNCKICKKYITNANIFDFSEKAYKAKYDEANMRWIFTANEDVLSVGKSFDITIPVEVVNTLVNMGYDSLSLNFERKIKNMAIGFSYNDKSGQLNFIVPVTLKSGEPVVIKNFKANTILSWVGEEADSTSKWINADGFILTLGASLNYNKNNPLSYIESNIKFTYDETNGYYFKAAEFENADITIRQGFIDDGIKSIPNGKLVITASTAGDFGGFIGIKHPDDKVFDYSGLSLERIYKLVDIKETGLTFKIHYGNSPGKVPQGFYFKLKVVEPADYSKVENWFKAKVDCKKINENTFDFTFPSVSGVPTIAELSREAREYLLSKGYNTLRVTYQSKDGENANAAVSTNNTVNDKFNNGQAKTLDIPIVADETVMLKSYYAAIGEGKATGVRITFEAVTK